MQIDLHRGPACVLITGIAPMKKFGVKLNNGKIMWVNAERADVREGALLFFRGADDQAELVAGFSLTQINHWGLPDAFASE